VGRGVGLVVGWADGWGETVGWLEGDADVGPYVGSTGRGARVGRRDGRGEGFCVGAAETSSVGWPVGVPASQDTPRFHQQSPPSAGTHSQHG